MSTTTEGLWRRVALALPLIVLGWLGTLAAVALATDAAPGYVALFPAPGLAEGLPEGAAILSVTPYSVTLRNPGGGFARQLYARGARLVLPAGLPGCLPLPSAGAPPR